LDLYNFYSEAAVAADITVTAIFMDGYTLPSSTISITIPALLNTFPPDNLTYSCDLQTIVRTTYAWCNFNFKFQLLTNCSYISSQNPNLVSSICVDNSYLTFVVTTQCLSLDEYSDPTLPTYHVQDECIIALYNVLPPGYQVYQSYTPTQIANSTYGAAGPCLAVLEYQYQCQYDVKFTL